MTRRLDTAIRIHGVLAALLLCGMGCAGVPLLHLPLLSQRAPRPSGTDSAIGRVDLVGQTLPTERVDPIQQRKSVLFARARLLEADRQPDKAAGLYRDVLEQDPQHSAAWHRLAVVSAEQGDVDTARDCFQKALRITPESAELHSDYGYFCYLLNRWDESGEHLTRAVMLNPENSLAHTNLGLLAARRGNAASAVQHFRRAGCSVDQAQANVALAKELASAGTASRDITTADVRSATAGFARVSN